ncbi:MAG: DinB family protein [Acidobacteriia bacterium]|nr:DinB family protein [Terriglobia bacterium]
MNPEPLIHMQTWDRFAAVLAVAGQRLSALSSTTAAARPMPDAWSKKQELGHLVDSAVNNYVRIIRVQRESAPALPGYEQDAWVERQGYDDRDWMELVALWKALNQHMLAAARRIPASSLARTCTIAGGDSVTLGFLIEDYVDHMVHHLQHIGIALSEFRRPESAYA